MDTKQFISTLRQIADEKSIPYEIAQDALEQAIAAAYRKDYGDREQQVRSVLREKDGSFRIFVTKEVVDEVENQHTQMTLEEARKVQPEAVVGDDIEQEVEYDEFGRVAAQTAKQVILQKIREAERDVVFAEYYDKVGTLLNGTIQRVEPRVVYVDVGKAQGILPQSEQMQNERYRATQRLKVYLRDVESTPRGPQLVLSRAHPDFIALLFANEVPEMEDDAVYIKLIAREAGVRTKLAVATNVPGVDPVGTFVGGHGTRVQAVMNEVGDEKIDIITYSEDPKELIENALSPTKITSIDLDEEQARAKVIVPEGELSVAIGRSGQNVRLASKLTDWQIDIESEAGDVRTESENVDSDLGVEQEPEAKEKPNKSYVPKAKMEESLLEALESGSDEETDYDQKEDAQS